MARARTRWRFCSSRICLHLWSETRYCCGGRSVRRHRRVEGGCVAAHGRARLAHQRACRFLDEINVAMSIVDSALSRMRGGRSPVSPATDGLPSGRAMDALQANLAGLCIGTGDFRQPWKCFAAKGASSATWTRRARSTAEWRSGGKPRGRLGAVRAGRRGRTGESGASHGAVSPATHGGRVLGGRRSPEGSRLRAAGAPRCTRAPRLVAQLLALPQRSDSGIPGGSRRDRGPDRR